MHKVVLVRGCPSDCILRNLHRAILSYTIHFHRTSPLYHFYNRATEPGFSTFGALKPLVRRGGCFARLGLNRLSVYVLYHALLSAWWLLRRGWTVVICGKLIYRDYKIFLPRMQGWGILSCDHLTFWLYVVSLLRNLLAGHKFRALDQSTLN